MPPILKQKIHFFISRYKPLLLLGVLILAGFIIFRWLLPLKSSADKEGITTPVVRSIFFNTEPPLNKFENRTNVLLLGIGGGDHEGADLSDTMLVISLDWQKKDAVMISVPRDLWMESLKDRINTSYHYGQEKKKGGGILLSKAMVEEVIGKPVHYSWVIDFSGFQKMVDLVGGVDINIEQTFSDDLYPISGKENDLCNGDPAFTCRYEKLKFNKGIEHMSGERVLKYVRSRHAEGTEGTDFARSKRQQQMVLALKQKLFSTTFIWNNLSRWKEFMKVYDETTDTDMKIGEQMAFFKSFLGINNQSTRRIVLDDGDAVKGLKGFLINPPSENYKGQWVLIPRTGNFDEIHKFISCQLSDSSCSIKP